MVAPVAEGAAHTVDGRGPYRVGDAQALMAASLAAAGGRLVLCENHATDIAAPQGKPSPARGWIVDLQHRADGIWGRVDWTNEGRRLVEAKEYRGVSPVIAHRPDGTVTAILRATLTNTPNLTGLIALHSTEKNMQLIAQVRTVLGLPVDAPEETIVAKIRRLMAEGDGRTVATQAQMMEEANRLALQASEYRTRLAQNGVTISHAVAVRAVQDGKAG